MIEESKLPRLLSRDSCSGSGSGSIASTSIASTDGSSAATGAGEGAGAEAGAGTSTSMPRSAPIDAPIDRQRVVSGKSGSVRGDIGGCRVNKNTKKRKQFTDR